MKIYPLAANEYDQKVKIWVRIYLTGKYGSTNTIIYNLQAKYSEKMTNGYMHFCRLKRHTFEMCLDKWVHAEIRFRKRQKRLRNRNFGDSANRNGKP